MEGLVIKSTGSWYEVAIETAEGPATVMCRLKGLMRLDETKDTNPVAVGDKVAIEPNDTDDSWLISTVLPRRNYIVRSSPKHKGARQVIAANIDQAMLVVTMANPRTSTGFIDRFLITAEAYHIPVLLVFNKQDLLDTKTARKQDMVCNIYEQVGYDTIKVSGVTGYNIEELRARLKDKTTLVSGHSGVGKSTLMNALQPNLNLRTTEISKFSGKGMHTTTFAEMHMLDFGAKIIDTPGIREFGIMDFKPEEISHYFIEMRELLASCKFNNCTHQNEPGCAVRQAYSEGRISEERYGNYLNILLDYKANYKHWE